MPSGDHRWPFGSGFDDYPGPARDVLERSLGGLAVFLQGCGGNINPTYGIGYEVDCRDIKMRMGLALGGEALKVASGIRTHIKPGARKPLGNIANILFTPWEPVSGETCTYLGAVEQDLPLEFGELPPLAQAEAIRTEKQQRLADLRSRNAAEWEIRVAETFDRWGEMLVASVKHGHPTCDLTIQAFRVNDIVIAGMNAKVFYETGLALRARSPLSIRSSTATRTAPPTTCRARKITRRVVGKSTRPMPSLTCSSSSISSRSPSATIRSSAPSPPRSDC